jgi:PAS domain-containing protein
MMKAKKRGSKPKPHAPKMTTKEFTRRVVLQTFDARFSARLKKPFAEGKIQVHNVDWQAGFERARQLGHEALFDMLEDGTLRINVDETGMRWKELYEQMLGIDPTHAIKWLLEQLPGRYWRKRRPRENEKLLRKLDRVIQSFDKYEIGPTVKEVARAMSCTEDQVEDGIPVVNKLMKRRYRIIADRRRVSRIDLYPPEETATDKEEPYNAEN